MPQPVMLLGVDVDPAHARASAGGPTSPALRLASAAATVIAARDGEYVRRSPTGIVVAFAVPSDAIEVALRLHQEMATLRVALHARGSGPASEGRSAATARRCENLREIAHPGQTLLTASAASALSGAAAPGQARVYDLGIHRLRDLSPPERIFELTSSIPRAPKSLDAYPNNLPTHLTSFIGRRSELADVRALLTDERLVTLTGAGGSGKTRIAAQVAADLVDQWQDGVRWVELAQAKTHDQAAQQVADATGVAIERAIGTLRSLTLQLADQQLLLCLDNCEHVLDDVAAIVGPLLAMCPDVRVLTTSREPLSVAGEVVWTVPTLTEDEALALFVERAQQIRPAWQPEEEAEAVIRRMCARLDGIPLALELAASWLRTLTPWQIEAGLDDRFALLVRGRRRGIERHETLSTSISWSHDLLDEPDRVLFRRLSVFPGDFGLEAVRAVCDGEAVRESDILGALRRLVDKSLLTMEDARYRMLETIREYATVRLRESGEEAAMRDQHLGFYLALAEGSAADLDRDKDAWRAWLEAEHDNLRAALDHGLVGSDPEPGRRLAAALPWLWHLHGHGREGFEFLWRAINLAPHDRCVLQARLLAGVALVADTAGPLDLEYDVAQRAAQIAAEQGDHRLHSFCVLLAAVGRLYTDFDGAWELSREAETEAEQAADGFVRDGASALQGMILHLHDRHEAALPVLNETAARLLARGDRGVAATALAYAAAGELATGRPQVARAIAERAVAIAEPLGDYHRAGMARSILALIVARGGDVDGGLRVLDPILRLVEAADGDVFVPWLARARGMLHLMRAEPEQAARWLEREARSADHGSTTYLGVQALPGYAVALRRLGRAAEARSAIDQAVRLARAFDMPGVLAEALEQRGHLAADADPEAAAGLHHEALTIRVNHGLRASYPDSLDALGSLAAGSVSQARFPYAVRLLAASTLARGDMGLPKSADGRATHSDTVAALRASAGEEAFAREWEAGERMSLDEAVAYARRARGSRNRPATGWASLTTTEREVVRLAAEGHSNPDIGARLFISRGTVKTHLAHIYAKLGISNRTELARLSASHDDL